MAQLITPEELPTWVPGEIIGASDGLGWNNVTLRAYRYLGQDVFIPPMRDHMIVSYKQGDTPMERRFDGTWTQTKCAPGSISLLTQAQRSSWNWSQNINVCHIYLSDKLLTRIASEATDNEVTGVRLKDILNVEDPIITNSVEAIRQEASQGAMGGPLYAEAIATQLAIHLLRHYASIKINEINDGSKLSRHQERKITEFVDANLDQNIDMHKLATVAGLGQWSFSRRFRATFGIPPHRYLIEKRVERARKMIEDSATPLKQIASACGFSDQAHMTRVFQSRLNVTPGRLRREANRG